MSIDKISILKEFELNYFKKIFKEKDEKNSKGNNFKINIKNSNKFLIESSSMPKLNEIKITSKKSDYKNICLSSKKKKINLLIKIRIKKMKHQRVIF